MANKDNQQIGIQNLGTFTTGGSITVDQQIHTGLALKEQLDHAFKPLEALLDGERPEAAEESKNQINELKKALAQGKGSSVDDKRAASILETIREIAPEAASAIITTFATPFLKGLAGPATEYVLEKMHIPHIGS